MTQEKIYYKNIFMYASLQFCGNIEEYFSNHSKKLVVYILMPRLKNKGNVIRLYNSGKLISEEQINLSENVLFYYLKLIYYHWYILFKYFRLNEKFYIISGHPFCFFGLAIQKRLWRSKHIYWIGDYFPGDGKIIRLFEKLKKNYHNVVPFALYLSDGINKVFNEGRIVNTLKRKTVMWGVKSINIKRNPHTLHFNILFVGLIKDSQGLENIFELLKANKFYRLTIVGECNKSLYSKYKKIILKNKITKQVDFPNKFVSEQKLLRLSVKSKVGVALYDVSINNPTYYTDPGKVKAYTQLGLPVIMSNTSGIAEYVRKFKCGEIINEKNNLDNAIRKINANYGKYLAGIKKFNSYFAFNTYYREKFSFMEKL